MTETAPETSSQLLRRAIAQSALGRFGATLTSVSALEVTLAPVLAVCTFLAALPALHAYKVAGAAIVVAAAAAGSTAAAFVGARLLRLPPAGSYSLSLVGLLVVLLSADGPHPGTVAAELVRGPNRVLTETLPLSGGRAAISALVVLVWLCGAATSESLIRTAGRSRVPFGLAIPILLYLLCFAVASSAPVRDRVGGPLLLVALSLSAALTLPISQQSAEVGDPGARPAPRYRSATTGIVSAAAAASGLALLAPAVPGLGSRPAHIHRRPPTVAPLIADPVDSMAQLRDSHPHSPPTSELTATLSAPSTGYLAMGYLDSYNGGQWRFSATFEPTGGRVPDPRSSAGVVSNNTVVQHIRITGALPVPLLPGLDRPRFVTGLDVVSDGATGMLLPQSPTPHPDYTLVSQTPDVTLLGLSPADGIAGAPDVSDLQLPPNTSADLATTLRFLSALTGGQRPAGTVEFLQTALQTLHSQEKRIDPSLSAPVHPTTVRQSATTVTRPSASESGTSLSQVINAVTVNRAATPEQFATFYAMIARYLGVPARVVTGFRLLGSSSGGPVPAGTYQVTNRQAWAWVEIPVQGIGWVVCDPTPDATTAAASAPPEAVSAPPTTLPPRQANAVPRNQSVGGHALARPSHIRFPSPHPIPAWVYVGAGLGALLLAVLALGPGLAALRRALRRRRRRSSDPSVLAVGAWLELLDGLDRAGMRPAAGATASEVAGEVGHHFGPELVPEAASVAALADQAVFSTVVPVSADAALAAWRSSQELRRRVLGGLDLGQRVRSSLSVGSAPSRPSGGGR